MAKDSTNDTMHPKFSSVQKGAFCTLLFKTTQIRIFNLHTTLAIP